jgi:hypothetical protein
MGHETSLLLIFDVLYDFPANAILQRVGLLETLLDIIGSAVSNEEEGLFVHTILTTPPLKSIDSEARAITTISPISVMQWFEILLEKCKTAFEQILNGSLTCGVLESLPSQHHGSVESAQLVSSLMNEMN